MTPDRPVLISLRPRYAEAILAETKSVELRRRRVAASPGSLVVMYSASPVRAIVGTARLDWVDIDSAESIWAKYSERMGLLRTEFDDYLKGTDVASALLLSSVVTLSDPMTLGELRLDSDFHPPQSYRYLSETDPDNLHLLGMT